MGDAVIDLRNVKRTFRIGDFEVRALRGVSLTVARGEFLAIMGSSGSGKSTLMAILGCLDQPSDGRYFLEGVDVAGLSESELARIRSERIGFVFQSFNLLPRTSAIENVALPLFYSDRAATSTGARIDRSRAALRLMGLADRENNTPAQLSGGQQQRVAIARALVNYPSIILADEPTGNLDSQTGVEIMALFDRLHQQGNTIVLVTHEHDIAEYAHRIIHIKDGQVFSDQKTARA